MLTLYFQHYGPCPLNQKRQTEHEAGMALLSRGLSDLYGIHIPAQDIESCLSYGAQKKPYLTGQPDIHFNISNCDGLVVCAFAEGPVGVDIEPVGDFNEHILRKLLTEKEKSFLNSLRNDHHKYQEYFYRFWTLKESRIKQSGEGLAMPLTGFSFEFDRTDGEPVIHCSESGFYFHQQILEGKYVLSVCTQTPAEELHLIGIEHQRPKHTDGKLSRQI